MAKKKLPPPEPRAMDAYDYYVYPCTFEESIEANEQLAMSLIEETDFEFFNGSTQNFVSNQIIQPLNYFKANKHRNVDLEKYRKAYEVFSNIITKVNEKFTYTPIVNTFCRFISMSKERFEMIARENSDRGELFKEIKDNLSENVLQNMMGNRINPVTGIFICKANFGMRDQDNASVNVVNFNSEPKGLEEILAEFKKIGH